MKILLYVDDSRLWHPAAPLVAQAARRTGGHVTVLTTAWLAMHRRRALDDARRLLALPADRIRTLERPGLIEYVLPDVAREEAYDLAVVARLGSLDRLTNGLIGSLLVRRTPTNVLLLRGRVEHVRRILVCTEGPRHGEIDFERALRGVQAFDAELTVLHVLSQMAITPQAQDALQDYLRQDTEIARHLRRLEQRMRDEGVPGRVRVRKGLVVEEILAEAEEGKHDLLVIGAHEAEGAQSFLYEDLQSRLVRESPISTLVVRDNRRA